MNTLSFGEILWDIIDGQEHIGGAPFNFAAHLAQCGGRSYLVSRVGKDERGSNAIRACSQYKVSTDFLQQDEHYPTGTVQVQLANGQPDYTIDESVAYDFIAPDQKLLGIPSDFFNVFYFGSLAQRHPVSANTLEIILKHFSFNYIFYDVNLRKKGYTSTILATSLNVCTVLKLNHEEVPVIAEMLGLTHQSPESFCSQISAVYPTLKIIIVTASDKGCFIYTDNRLTFICGRTVAVKDAVGAGDAFSAAFMYTLFTKQDAFAAASAGNEIGAYVVTQQGAIPKYPENIKTLLST
jgi:fructokinase